MKLDWEHTNEPIPPDHIRLADAFEEFYQKSIPDWEERLAQAKAAIAGATNAAAVAEARAANALVMDPDEKAALVEQARRAARAKRPKAVQVGVIDDGRVEAAKKFVVALAAGGLQPIIQRANGTIGLLPPKLWTADEHVPLVAGRDAVCDGHVVFLDLEKFQDWCRIEGPTSPHAQPIDLCRQQLKTWTVDHETLRREVKKWGGVDGRIGKAWISRALAAWLLKTRGKRISAEHVENQLRAELTPAVDLL